MKHVGYLFVWALVLSTVNLHAQQINIADETTEKESIPLVTNILKISTVAFLDETFELGYERFNKRHTGSWNVNFGIQGSNSNSRNQKFGFKYDLQYRAYPMGLGERYSKIGNLYRRGIYGGVFLRGEIIDKTYEFYHFDVSQNFGTDRTNEQEITAFNPGVLIGIQRTFFDIIYIDVFLGGGMRFVSIRNSDPLYDENQSIFRDIYDDDYEGVVPRFGLSIGLGF